MLKNPLDVNQVATARVENKSTSICPLCNKNMKRSVAAESIPIYVCLEHRVVMPVED